jgi:hypothetical protein
MHICFLAVSGLYFSHPNRARIFNFDDTQFVNFSFKVPNFGVKSKGSLPSPRSQRFPIIVPKI